MKTPLPCIALLAILCATPQPLLAQSEVLQQQASVNDAWLSVHVDPLDRALIVFGVPLQVKERQELERSLSQSFRFPVSFNAPRVAPLSEEELDDFARDELAASSYWTIVSGQAPNAFPDRALKSWCRIDVEHLKVLVVFEHNYDVRISGTQRLEIEGVRNYGNYYQQDIDVRSPAIATIQFAKGYSILDMLIKTAPLLLFLFLPALWIIVRSLSAPSFAGRSEELWSKHLRFLHRLLYALWLIWLPVFSLSDLSDLIAFFFLPYGTRVIQFVVVFFYFVPLIVAMFLCHFASARIYRHVHVVDWSPRQVVRRVIWLNVFSLMPLFLLVLIINALGQSLRQAALYGVVGYIVWLVLNHGVTQVWGSKLHALTSGDLRDRIFELASQAGVLLRQIYVLPEDRAQLSNAFARSDDSVMISASLIKNLSRREVDAIMAHEIGHLKDKHPQTSNTMMLVVMIVTNCLAMTLHKVIDAQHSLPVLFSASLAVGTLVIFFVSRKNEQKADAIGISLTGDPEAFISGFAKLSRLNLTPLHSGGWGESIETHPSSMRRLAEIANAHGISPERLQSLIAGNPESVESRYTFVAQQETGPEIFSTDFKTKYRLRYGLMVCAAVVLTPIPFAWMLDRPGSRVWLVITAVAGLILPFALGQLVRNKLTYWGQGSFSSQLRDKFAKRGLNEIAKSGMLVGLAPAAETRKFEDYQYWDVGLLWVTREKLYYFGERVEFALNRNRITEVYAADPVPEWIAEKNLYVRWQNSREANDVLHFVAAGESSLLKGRRTIDHLQKQLEAWLNKPEEFPSAPTSLASVAEPSFPEITSSAPVTSFQLSTLLKGGTMVTGFALVLGYAIQLSFWSIGYMAGVVFLCTLADELPKFFGRPEATRQARLQTYRIGSWAESNAATPTRE
jgi:Zn-dependent protease with chaperone function